MIDVIRTRASGGAENSALTLASSLTLTGFRQNARAAIAVSPDRVGKICA
jgi:hypothetical protein